MDIVFRLQKQTVKPTATSTPEQEIVIYPNMNKTFS
jgi:hypothetical protein